MQWSLFIFNGGCVCVLCCNRSVGVMEKPSSLYGQAISLCKLFFITISLQICFHFKFNRIKTML
uniref:Uncharacterized protein n=1 Tax=Anopheles quadriannulatus TaxID=34691 RepID=A0A182XRQ5_ANOQN